MFSALLLAPLAVSVIPTIMFLHPVPLMLSLLAQA